jgi:hypothetical protein
MLSPSALDVIANIFTINVNETRNTQMHFLGHKAFVKAVQIGLMSPHWKTFPL